MESSAAQRSIYTLALEQLVYSYAVAQQPHVAAASTIACTRIQLSASAASQSQSRHAFHA
jgi:hypothetical protein